MKIGIAAILAVIVFVVGDWFELFGARTEQVPDFIHIVFEMRDSAGGAPVDDVHVVCSRTMSRSVCTEKLTGIPGQTEITFGVFRQRRASILFDRELGFSLGRNGEMTLTFVHPNYERRAMLVTEAMIAGARRQKIAVRLERSAAN